MTTLAPERLAAAKQTAVETLLSARNAEGHWTGRLSSSALSTATAVSAFALAKDAAYAESMRAGIAWLRATQNADGGWGDTPDSPSNLSTSLLALAAFTLASEDDAGVRRYIDRHAGEGPARWTDAVLDHYGDDRTFAVPILMNCALAGLVPWEGIPPLPCELAAVPARWYAAVNLQVVSYALPALIAVGLCLEHHAPTGNLVRRWTRGAILDKLARIQPEHGGFLDATPLTAFVAMALLPMLGADHPVVRRCLGFLQCSLRADGSWPIDTDLSVWLTTGALSALAAVGALDRVDAAAVGRWVAARQYRAVHPYTNAAPGGWGWTDKPGGVPDADDTAGAMLALARAGITEPLAAGARWLLDLQNADGGWPTFCRGWGRLPFDTSSPDITAHAMRALQAAGTGEAAIGRGFAYLAGARRRDGAWVPLWFGNQAVGDRANAVYGTARVLLAYAETAPRHPLAASGVAFLVGSRNLDGGWGGDLGAPSTVEETAQAVTALAAWPDLPGARAALGHGVDYLVARIEDGTWTRPAPIGLYFASLWYSEALYPVIWTVEALGRADVV
jgi:squalene-hopene/tetraprenyl-beta-curcumene cyclase